MPRVQCLDCRRIISGYEIRSYAVEYAYCERCYKCRFQKLEVLLAGYQAAERRAKEEEKKHAALLKQAHFLSSWDADTPLSDVLLQAPDGCGVPAHKAVLASKSPVFKAMFHTPMKEANSGLVLVDDLPHEVLNAFVRFFYTASVCPDVMKQHAHALFCAAEKYGVKLLKLLCEDFIVATVSRENAITTLELARKYDSEAVRDAVLHAAALDMDKIHTYADYRTYAEKDPTLIVELYEGMLKRMSRKRSRSLDDEEAESSRPSKALTIRENSSSYDDAQSTTSA